MPVVAQQHVAAGRGRSLTPSEVAKPVDVELGDAERDHVEELVEDQTATVRERTRPPTPAAIRSDAHRHDDAEVVVAADGLDHPKVELARELEATSSEVRRSGRR
ncbi:MAG: hypothetical protein IPF99_13705 [Deltaproteobacteria bacterium]|nr:hypothetical protein [Deltaproteobacteria bacterium]